MHFVPRKTALRRVRLVREQHQVHVLRDHPVGGCDAIGPQVDAQVEGRPCVPTLPERAGGIEDEVAQTFGHIWGWRGGGSGIVISVQHILPVACPEPLGCTVSAHKAWACSTPPSVQGRRGHTTASLERAKSGAWESDRRAGVGGWVETTPELGSELYVHIRLRYRCVHQHWRSATHPPGLPLTSPAMTSQSGGCPQLVVQAQHELASGGPVEANGPPCACLRRHRRSPEWCHEQIVSSTPRTKSWK